MLHTVVGERLGPGHHGAAEVTGTQRHMGAMGWLKSARVAATRFLAVSARGMASEG
jgi:hypothetical protein